MKASSNYLCPACFVKCLLLGLNTECILLWRAQRKIKTKLEGSSVNETRWPSAALSWDASKAWKENLLFFCLPIFLTFPSVLCFTQNNMLMPETPTARLLVCPQHLFTAQRQGHLIFTFHRAISVKPCCSPPSSPTLTKTEMAPAPWQVRCKFLNSTEGRNHSLGSMAKELKSGI